MAFCITGLLTADAYFRLGDEPRGSLGQGKKRSNAALWNDPAIVKLYAEIKDAIQEMVDREEKR